MAAGIATSGRVCGVPSEGIRRLGRSPEIRAAVHDGAVALASPYAPDAPFSIGNAMGRNKPIYGLSDVTVVVTSDNGKGGTWEGAVEALQKEYGRVIVWSGEGAGPGNRPLVDKGAMELGDISDDRWLVPQVRTVVERDSQDGPLRLF